MNNDEREGREKGEMKEAKMTMKKVLVGVRIGGVKYTAGNG